MPTETTYDLSACCCGNTCQSCPDLVTSTLHATTSGAFIVAATLTAVSDNQWESDPITCDACTFYIYMTCSGGSEIQVGIIVTAGGSDCIGCNGSNTSVYSCGPPFSATATFAVGSGDPCDCGNGSLTIEITE